jgi:hypothetical protein
MGAITALPQILEEMTGRYRWEPARVLRDLYRLWHEAVGPEVARHTRILGFSRGVLVVGVPSTVWGQELQLLKPAIMERIRHLIPGGLIKDLRTRVMAANRLHDEIRRQGPTERGGRFTRTNRVSAKSLPQLLHQVQDHYESAREYWLHNGYHPCVVCGAPSLDGYPVCAVCQWMGQPGKE